MILLFMQIIKQTDEEKMKMYMKLPKKKLCEMLIQCNKIIDNIKPTIQYHIPKGETRSSYNNITTLEHQENCKHKYEFIPSVGAEYCPNCDKWFDLD